MANVQIRRYVSGTGWVDLHPRTLVGNVMGGTNNTVPLVSSGGKINTTFLPDYLLGQLVYGGTVSADGVATLSTNAKSKLGISDNTITLGGNTTGSYAASVCEGLYFIASSNQDDDDWSDTVGIEDLKVGDWVIATASSWKKIDNTDAVTSVCGRTGAVTIGTSDVSGLSDLLLGKVDKVSGYSLIPDTLITKLNGIETGANKTTVDAALSSDSTNPVQNKIINAAIATINSTLENKVNKDGSKVLSTNDFTDALKNKLNGIADGANNYVHPNDLNTTLSSGLYKIAVNAKGHVTAGAAVTKADITALGIPAQDTTYSDATTSTHGLLTSANLKTLINLRSVGSSNPASATDGDIAFITVS